MSARLLIIALDGADGILLDRWSADGTLPNLAALRARGATKRLSAPAGVTDDALWASFQYAESIGEHGRNYFYQGLDNGGMDMAYLNEADRESFWQTLSNQGLQVGIFDVPKCGLPRPINGIHLVDWLVHGRYFMEPKSHPESLAGEVVEKFGPAPPSRCGGKGPSPSVDEEKEVVANMRLAAARKRAAGLHYLNSEPWDLFVIGFKEAHCAGHRYWDLTDPKHGDYDPERNALLGDPFRTIFRDLDAAVGDLVAAVGPDTPVAVFSTTDMEPNATLNHLMPAIGKRLRRRLGESPIARGLRYVMKRFGATSPIAPLCDLMPSNENCAAIRVNPQGGFFRHTPGYERKKAKLVERAESLLRELVDADTGLRVIAVIDRPSAQYPGKRAAALPDLLLRCAPNTLPRAVVSPRLGRIEAEVPQLRTGNHAVGGFLVSTGDAFAGVNAMEDFGSAAAKALQVAMK